MKQLLIILTILTSSFIVNAQKRDTVYVLNGYIKDFQLLYSAVVTPKDVTPNQVEAILRWIESIKPIKPEIDSVKVKK